jgi:parallel beta-helix repeat protein
LPQNTEANLINNEPLGHITINGNHWRGLTISGDQDTTIQGLIFEDFGSDGILVYIGGNDVIANNVFVGNHAGIYVSGLETNQGDVHITGNFIGYHPINELPDPNTRGIHVKDLESTDGTCNIWIGGLNAEDRNFIAGNGQSGIYIDNDKSTTYVNILNNYIGMIDDTTPVYNYKYGIEVIKSRGPLVIGGDYLTQGNLIAGNRNIGIYVEESSNASIRGNTFSSNKAGTAYIPNQFGDIAVSDSPYLRIGGDSPNFGNVIPQGLRVEKDEVNNQNLLIKHNFIGISRTGYVFPTDLPSYGINVEFATGFPEISYNQITNFRKGIVLSGTTMVPIMKNKIYNNSEMGIDLNNDGVTLNDNLDLDTGPNGLQNFPIISNVDVDDYGAVKIINFDVTLHSAANKQYLIEVFSNPFCGSNGYGQGKQVFAFNNGITTNGDGNSNIWHISELYPTNIIGPCLSATATEFDGVHYLGTSEFSQGVMAWQPEKLYLPMIVK